MDIFKKNTYQVLQYVLSSVVYRLIIILYGAIIVLTHDNIFSRPYYALLVPVYVVLYLLLIADNWKYARLLLDLSIIYVVLYGKTPLDSICLVYALFPLISAITHTGTHSKYWPVLLLTLVLLIALERSIDYSHVLVAFIIWLAGIQSWYSNQTNRLLSSLTAHIDDFFTDNDGSIPTHRIYRSFIEEINSYLGKEYLTDICSYIVRGNDQLWVVNSSGFIWERITRCDPRFLELLIHYRYRYVKHEHAKYFYIERRGERYVYKCGLNAENERIDFRKGYAINHVLELTFAKDSTVLASEYRIKETRRKAFEETKGHIDYVTRALTVMHFVRNKLSPIKNVISFYSNLDKMDAEKVKNMEDRVRIEVVQASKDLSEIINTANYLLDKQNNPYGGSDMENKTIEFLFVTLSEIVEHHLGGIVNVSDEIKGIEQRKTIRVSSTQSKLLFTDIVSNIEKYKKSEYSVDMGIDGDYVSVAFMNDFEAKKEADCNCLVRDINNKNNEGIVGRKSHGVYNIKAAALLMEVDLKADIVVDKTPKRFIITTYFKMYDGDE